MRFIQLMTDGKESTHFETIIKFGCGPNYVLNRSHLFKCMIKDQGLSFWFRFWLKFCMQPSCYDMCMVQREWPNMTSFILGSIHKQFLDGSVGYRTNYCLEQVIRPMHGISRNKSQSKTKFENSKLQLQNLVTKCLGFAFGCALCDVFFKWLGATQIPDNDQSYWTIPDCYLKPNYKPKLLEKYLIDNWKESLIPLLGLDEEQAGWIKSVLDIGEFKVNLDKEVRDEIENYCDANLIQQTSEFMREIRNGRKKQIHDIDETINKTRYLLNVGNEINEHRSKHNVTCKIYRQCNYCSAIENKNKKFKKCKRCVDNLWSYPRYYCSETCQASDWYQLHHDEHRAEKRAV